MYHFIGIKGAGMRSLAVIMKQLGYEVQGSDVEKHFFTEEELVKNNIKFFSYNEENITDNLVIIKGLSIADDNEELIKAKKLNLEIFLNVLYFTTPLPPPVTSKYPGLFLISPKN